MLGLENISCNFLFWLLPAVSTRDPIIGPRAVADNGRGLILRVITKNAFSYMLSNEILRFLSEIEIDITTGGH